MIKLSAVYHYDDGLDFEASFETRKDAENMVQKLLKLASSSNFRINKVSNDEWQIITTSDNKVFAEFSIE